MLSKVLASALGYLRSLATDIMIDRQSIIYAIPRHACGIRVIQMVVSSAPLEESSKGNNQNPPNWFHMRRTRP